MAWNRGYIEHAPFSGVLTVEHSKGLPVSLGMEACTHACVYLEGSCYKCTGQSWPIGFLNWSKYNITGQLGSWTQLLLVLTYIIGVDTCMSSSN